MFTSKIDILLPSYLKSASESVHQLYGASEALSYLEYFEELAHPATYLLEYIMSRAASDIGDISGVMGGRPQPPYHSYISACIAITSTSVTSWTS